jgi:hypothetical protein
MKVNRVSSIVGAGVAACFVLSAVGCDALVSLDSMIGAGEAIAVPTLVGDWIADNGDGDSSRVRITPQRQRFPHLCTLRSWLCDSTSYILESIDDTTAVPASLRRPMWSLHVTRAGSRLFAEITPAGEDAMVDSVADRYENLIELLYQVAVVEFVGNEAHVWGFDVDSVWAALRTSRCPSPNVVFFRNGPEIGDLIFSGTAEQLRRTNECLATVPGVLVGPFVYRRTHFRNYDVETGRITRDGRRGAIYGTSGP